MTVCPYCGNEFFKEFMGYLGSNTALRCMACGGPFVIAGRIEMEDDNDDRGPDNS